MKYVIVSPNKIDDEYVYNIAQLRFDFMQNARIVNGDEIEKMEVVNFPTNDFHYFDWDEKKKLEATWENILNFNEVVLPNVRKTLLSVIENKEKDCVHIDLGKSLLTLYIAYFCAIEGIMYNISFHMPDPKEEKQVFNVGGESSYSDPRNNLRRYLATKVIENAMTVFIDNPTVAKILERLFPRSVYDLHIDPLIQIAKSEEKELQNVGD